MKKATPPGKSKGSGPSAADIAMKSFKFPKRSRPIEPSAAGTAASEAVKMWRNADYHHAQNAKRSRGRKKPRFL